MGHTASFLPPRDISELPADLGFRVGHSTVSDGNMSFSWGEEQEVLANRERFFARVNIPSDRLIPFVTEHKTDIHDFPDYPFDGRSLKDWPKLVTDAIVSRIPGAGVFLGFADCVPFVVYDRLQHILMFAHIGWRSMAGGLTGKTIRYLKQHHGSQAQDLYAVIGPSIKPSSYLFRDPIQAKEAAWEPFLYPQPDGRMGIDLFGFCTREATAAGIPPEQLFAYYKDTATDPELFSHYMATEGGQPEKQGRIFFYGWIE
jgi:copper oxidase (laccase) domain-containing protein